VGFGTKGPATFTATGTAAPGLPLTLQLLDATGQTLASASGTGSVSLNRPVTGGAYRIVFGGRAGTTASLDYVVNGVPTHVPVSF
jgi:hypothetical protein